jgi:NAD(P)H-hydrate epimerase
VTRNGGDARGKRSAPEPIAEEWAVSALPRRATGAHKWGVGGVVVVAGSPLYAGAAALCCAAAGRSGAGIVSAAVPRSIVGVVVGAVPEATVVVVPEGESVSVAERAAKRIGERLERSRAMVVGPGLGSDEAAAALLGALFGFTRVRGGIGFGAGGGAGEADDPRGPIAAGKPVVVDADGLNWLGEQPSWWERVPAGALVLTPHPGEMARLSGEDAERIVAEPARVAREAAAKWSQTVVLKGGETVVAGPDGALRSCPASPALATAGSGDVLSGSIGAFLAQGLEPLDAASLAVYVGNRAAERVARRYGTLGVVAGDLPAAIAEELHELETRGESDA